MDTPPDLFDPIHAFICISTAIVCSVSIVCSILLLRAAFKNDGSKLLIPWLVVDIILRCIHVIVLISGIILATRDTVSHGVATVIIMTFDIGTFDNSLYALMNYMIPSIILRIHYCFTGLESYMWWIVLCFYRQLKSHETICVQAEPFELQDMHVY